jgi:hypothetical protein
MPADCPVSEGLPAWRYVALLGVGVISGVISGAVSGTPSGESAARLLSGCLSAFCDLRRLSCECQPSPATRIETSHFSKNLDAVDADADDENRGDCCRKDFSGLVGADGYAVGFVSGAVAKFERKINTAP